MDTTGRKTREFTGKHMAMVMVGFFGVIIAVNATMAWLASNSWTGLVVKNSYVASQGYNEKLASARAQEARGWSERVGYRDERLVLELRNEAGSPIVMNRMNAEIGRPAAEFADRRIEFAYLGGGRYEAHVPLAEGVWQVTLNSGQSDEPFHLEARIHVREDGTGSLQ